MEAYLPISDQNLTSDPAGQFIPDTWTRPTAALEISAGQKIVADPGISLTIAVMNEGETFRLAMLAYSGITIDITDFNSVVAPDATDVLFVKAASGFDVFDLSFGVASIADGALTIAKTNGLQASLDSKLPLAGGTVTGALTVEGGTTTGILTLTALFSDDVVFSLVGNDGFVNIASGANGSFTVGSDATSVTFSTTSTFFHFKDALQVTNEIRIFGSTTYLNSTQGFINNNAILTTAAGNAVTATALATSRDFSLTGVVTASAVGFNGTGNVALSTAIADAALSIAKTSGLQTELNGKVTLAGDQTLTGTLSLSHASNAIILDNGLADGAGLWWKSTGFDKFEVDNNNGMLRYLRYNSSTIFQEVILSIDSSTLTSAVDIRTNGVFTVDGTQVVSNQGAAVADATDAATAITQLNALLARCRAHGLIAT